MNSNTVAHFDAVVIGVGQAGNPLATALAEKGWKTAVIERNHVGGTCVNDGCTPTKTLIASAQMAYQARRSAEFGIETGDVRVDLKKVMARKNRMVETSRKNIETHFAETENLTLLFGEARFSGKKQIELLRLDGTRQTLTADTIFINAGCSPTKPDLAGLDTVPWLTSTSIMELEEVPEHLLILGGGYISLEFGQMFRRFGSEVTIIEQGRQLLSREDADVSDEMAKILEKEGITILLDTEVHQVSRAENSLIELQVSTNKLASRLRGTHLLVAVGRTPNTEALHLEVAGIETDEKGFIQVNDRLETSQPGVYALGDIKGGPEFTHISYDDYRIVNQNLLEKGNTSKADRPVPYTVFTDPQLGRIGLSEKEARRQGKTIKIANIPMSLVARAQQMSQCEGLMKVVIDAPTSQILGAAILGSEGGEIMTILQVAMMGHLPYQQLRDAIFAHPTLAEGLNTLFTRMD